MQYRKTFKTALNLCQFKSGPHEMPRSIQMFCLLLPIIYLCKFFTVLPWLSVKLYYQAAEWNLLNAAVYLVIYYAALYGLMVLWHHSRRYLQTAIAIAAVTVLMYAFIALLAVFVLLWVNLVSLVSGQMSWHFGLQSYEEWFSNGVVLLTPLFNLFIIARIFQLSLDISYKKAFIINLIFLLATYSFEANFIRFLIMPG